MLKNCKNRSSPQKFHPLFVWSKTTLVFDQHLPRYLVWGFTQQQKHCPASKFAQWSGSVCLVLAWFLGSGQESALPVHSRPSQTLRIKPPLGEGKNGRRMVKKSSIFSVADGTIPGDGQEKNSSDLPPRPFFPWGEKIVQRPVSVVLHCAVSCHSLRNGTRPCAP